MNDSKLDEALEGLEKKRLISVDLNEKGEEVFTAMPLPKGVRFICAACGEILTDQLLCYNCDIDEILKEMGYDGKK